MKIAIATQDNEPDAEISQRGARARFFQIYDADGQLKEVLDNPYAANDHRVGPDVARLLNSLQVTVVVAGSFGPRFAEALQSVNIECLVQTGVAARVARQLCT